MLLHSFLGISGLRGLGGGAGGSGYPFLLVDAIRWVGKSADGDGRLLKEDMSVRTVAIKYVEGINYHVVERCLIGLVD